MRQNKGNQKLRTIKSQEECFFGGVSFNSLELLAELLNKRSAAGKDRGQTCLSAAKFMLIISFFSAVSPF